MHYFRATKSIFELTEISIFKLVIIIFSYLKTKIKFNLNTGLAKILYTDCRCFKHQLHSAIIKLTRFKFFPA